MALLNFKGKSAVWNHHLSVPYQTLEKDTKLSLKGKNADENLIIEADNLTALKSLLPKYQGKIRCIYIDPPYNTGNEGWVYNDSVNSPLIKDWIGQTVGADDLTRHDKWLCMMAPRLKLLRELLDDDGVIFISIDDNEIHNLIQLMKEIFRDDYIDTMVWRKSGVGRDGKMKNTTTFRKDHEYVLVGYNYTKNLNKSFEKPKWENEYDNKDNDPRGPYKAGSISNKEEASNPKHENYYSVESPSGKIFTRQFNVSEEEFEILDEDSRIYWGKNGDAVPAIKIFVNEKRKVTTSSLLLNEGTTTEGTKELQTLFNGKKLFDRPKPTTLIKKILQISTDKNSIILDSFAGSGTTAQAVLDLNKGDGGNRKFILIQLPEQTKKNKEAYKAGFKFVHEITRERVKRVIEKGKLGVGFTYMKLGPKIDAESILSGQLPSYKDLAKYIYFLATGKTMNDVKKIKEEEYFVGKIGSQSIHLIYKKDFNKLKNMALTLELAEQMNKKDKNKKLVYAPACFLDDENLEKFNIEFVSIPYSLFGKK